MIKRQLGEPIEGEYPPEFVERFPNLADVVSVQRTQVGRLL
jgi:adenine-specific DNA glycosylase